MNGDKKNYSSLAELVKAYYEKGFCVLPAVKKQKRPAIDWKEYQNNRPSLENTLKLFEGVIEPNVAIVCGRVSGIVVLDIDDRKKFEDWLKDKGHSLSELLNLPSAVKTGKGFHIYFRYPEGEDIGVQRYLSRGFEIRGNGGIVIAPPSLHPHGGNYSFRNLNGEDAEGLINYIKNLSIPPLPKWLLNVAKEGEAKVQNYELNTPTIGNADISEESLRGLIDTLVGNLIPYWAEGQRHDLATGLGGWLARLGIPLEIAETVVHRLVNATEDEEAEDRLRAVRDMYANLGVGNVRGISTIWRILGEEATKKLMRETYRLLELEEEPLSEEELEKEVVEKALKPQPFPFSKLPAYLQAIVKEFSEAFNVDREYTATSVLTIFSACVGNSLWAGAKADWRVPPFLWFCVVQETGGGKSPLLRELMRPLKKLQQGYWDIYQEEMKEWKRLSDEEKKGREAPKLKHIYAEDFTTEALAEIFSQDERGILIRRDELAGLIGALGQYKKKGGDDRQRLLELFDAEPWKVDRKGRPLFIPQTGASIIGGIQPQVLKRIFDASAFDEGLIPRFLWLVLPTRPRFWTEKEIGEHVRTKYQKLVKWAREIPDEGEVRTLILSAEAKELFKRFNDDFERLYIALPHPLKVFIPKLKTYTLKFALLHHLLKEAERTTFAHSESLKVKPLIQPESVEFAIELAHFFLGQAKKLIDQFSTPSRSWGLQDAIADLIVEIGKEREGELIPVREITELVNKRLNLTLSTRAVGTILKKLGFTEENGLRKRIPGKGNFGVLITETILHKLSSQSSQCSQNLEYQPSEGVKKDVKKNFSSQNSGVGCEERKKFTENFTASSHSPPEGCEHCEESEEKNHNQLGPLITPSNGEGEGGGKKGEVYGIVSEVFSEEEEL